MWLSFKWFMSDGPTPNEIVQLLIMAPAIALVTRFSVTRTLDQLRDSRNREQQRVCELRETLEKLQEETRLRKESETQLLQARKRESLGLMAAGVAHDFNNTLRAIGAVSELISLRSQEPESRDYAEEIGKAVQQASGICRQMLTYTGRSMAEKSALDLRSLITDFLPLLKASLSRHVTVEFTADVESAIIVGNVTQLQQVLMNLVKNAAESIDGVGSVTVQLSRRKVASGRLGDEQKWLGRVEPGDYFELTVTDTGSGMSEEVLSQIFDPYFTTKRTGHGLGLSSVQGIARSHSAVLGVTSQPGQGTTISLLIPDQPIVVQEPRRPESTLESPTDVVTRNILVVDDDDLVRTPLVTMLEHLGWNVAEAASGEDAIATVQHQTDFAAVLIDYSMSGMNGRETLHALRAAGCHCPAILCSGYISNPDDSSHHQGFGGFLQKPFRHQELATILDRIVRQ
jgi:signal transduction histidine kinase